MAKRAVKVSVIMPAKNVASTVVQAVESVLSQKGVSFELLIGDDGSTDKTWVRITPYLSDPRVRAWSLPNSLGLGGMSNFLIRRAKGAYISCCDGDDLLLTGHLRALAPVLDRNPRVGVVYADRLLQEPSGKRRLLRRSRGPTESWDLLEGTIGRGGTLVRRSLLNRVGGYRADLPFLEDVELFLRLAEVSRFHYHRGKPLYLYRKRPGSLSDQPPRRWAAVGRNIWKEAILRRHGAEASW